MNRWPRGPDSPARSRPPDDPIARSPRSPVSPHPLSPRRLLSSHPRPGAAFLPASPASTFFAGGKSSCGFWPPPDTVGVKGMQ